MTTFKQFVDKYNKNEGIKLATQTEIELLEKEFSIHLPADYKNFITTFGNIWTPDILDIVVDNQLDMNDVQEFWEIERIIDDKKNEWTSQLQTDIIPFASDCMGNIFGFLTADLKVVRQTADIYFFDHDFDTVDKISDSFTDWMSRFNAI